MLTDRAASHKMRPVQKTGTIPTSTGQGAEAQLSLPLSLPVRASNAGLFISRGVGAHPDRTLFSHELIYVRAGVLHIQEEERTFGLTPKQTLLLFPGRRHFGTAGYAANLSFYWLHFGVAPGREGGGTLPVQVPQHATVARPDHLANLFHRFLDDQETGALQQLGADLLLMQMLLEVAHSEAAVQSAPLLAGRAEIMIRQHFHEPLSTSSIARALSCNPDYLGRVFRQVYGHTLTEALLRRRVQHAKQRLLESSDRVETVAAQSGFQEVGYFRRVFQRFEGMPPSRYRRLYARQHVITV